MPDLLDTPPLYVLDHLATLEPLLDQPSAQGGVPPRGHDDLLLATWNIREFGRYTPKWTATDSDTPKRDLRSLLFIATILERFDVIALQELQGYTDALRQILLWLNRDFPARWRVVVSDVVRGEAGDNERLGYLFDSSRFDLDGLVGEIVIPPEEVGVSANRLDRQLAKTPYAVSLRSVKDTDVAFILTTVHLVWGDDPALRSAEANRLAEWIKDWAESPHVWRSDIFALGDFNADRVTNPDGTTNPVYQPFADILTVPDKMNAFPRTIFESGQDKHYDMITWHERDGAAPVLRYEDCGYFDIDSALRPRYRLTRGSFSFRISDHYPLWARFTY